MYKNDGTFANDLWKCSKCLNQDTEAHLLWCPGYQDMRQGLDLADNHDLCSYLQKIFILRCNEEKGWKLKSSHDLWLFSCTELVHFLPCGVWAEPDIVCVICFGHEEWSHQWTGMFARQLDFTVIKCGLMYLIIL